MEPPSPHDGRRRRSARTRALIVDAAATLFLEHGFVETTIDAIAEAAGVAPQTVYYVFGTKRNVLAAVLDTSVAGPTEPGAVGDQAWVAEVEEADDARTAIDALVRGGVEILARAAPIYEVVRSAAADPEVGALLERNRADRRTDQHALVASLSRRGLIPAHRVDDASDALYALLNEEIFGLLVGDCGWSVDHLRDWMSKMIGASLLDPPS